MHPWCKSLDLQTIMGQCCVVLFFFTRNVTKQELLMCKKVIKSCHVTDLPGQWKIHVTSKVISHNCSAGNGETSCDQTAALQEMWKCHVTKQLLCRKWGKLM